jgi:hypothetical protein
MEIQLNNAGMEVILKSYIDKFEMMNDTEHNEKYKWEQVKHFKETWDINAADFAAMFKESVSKAGDLINSNIRPTDGLIMLATEEQETVRRMFRKLYTKDTGDLKERQTRISDFVSESKALLNIYGKDKWMYSQDYRTVIMYLSLRYPESNFMYKYAEADSFAKAIGFVNDTGTDQTYDLAGYYEMCEMIVEAVKSDSRIMELQKDRLTGEWADGSGLHILAYDIIHCTQKYGLAGKTVVKKKVAKKAKIQEDEDAKKAGELKTRHDSLVKQLANECPEKAAFESISFVGMSVEHKKFGKGTITEMSGNNIIVRFKQGNKQFDMPRAISDKYLTQSDEDIFKKSADYAEALKKQEGIKAQLRGIETSLQKYD